MGFLLPIPLEMRTTQPFQTFDASLVKLTEQLALPLRVLPSQVLSLRTLFLQPPSLRAASLRTHSIQPLYLQSISPQALPLA